MSLVPTIYSSTDPGAPALTGQAGSLINVLRAVLVTGYGTGPNAKAGLGWTEEFTGVNKAVFRNSLLLGTGYRLRVDDSNAQFAWLRGHSTMSDIDTGADPTPTVAELASGSLWAKSITSDGVSRAWWAIGTEKFFYLFLDFNGAGLAEAVPYGAGDARSLIPGDQHNFFLAASNRTSFSTTATVAQSFLFFDNTVITASATVNPNGHFGRGPAQSVGAPSARLSTGLTTSTNGVVGSVGVAYPYPSPIGRLYYSPLLLRDGPSQPRAFLPGAYNPWHNRPFADLHVESMVDGLPSGASFIAKSFRHSGQSNTAGQVLFAIGLEWD